MLQGGGRHGKLDGFLRGLTGQQGVDQPGAEGIAAAHPVHDAEVVLLGEAAILTVVQHSGPVVVAGGDGGTQGDGHLLKAKLVHQLLGYALITRLVQLAAIDIAALSLDAEHVLGVLLVGDAHIHIAAQVGHSRPGLVPGPQLAPVVQVAGDLDPTGLGGLTGLLADLRHIGPQGGGDAGEVEPVGPGEDGVPVKVGGGRLGNGGVGPVVDAHAPPLGGPLLQVVDAHPVAAPDDFGGIHSKVPQRVHGSLTDGVGGQLGDIHAVQAVVGQGDRHIGLAAAEGGLHLIVLEEAVVAVGGQAKHQLAECNNFSHFVPP